MSATQIILIVLGLLIVYTYVKKSMVNRSVKHYNPDEAKEKIKNNKNTILLDVRTPGERKQQHIKGSLHIPLHEIDSRSKELDKYKDKEIICYCRSGNRSVNAAAKLKKKGFNSANMRGGIIRWDFGK